MVAIVSNCSARAIRFYLERRDLDNFVVLVIGRTGHDPELLKPSPYLVKRAIEVLDADPAICTMLGDSPTDIESAEQAGIASIAYANRSGKRDQFIETKAEAIITNLADLVLRIRARSVT